MNIVIKALPGLSVNKPVHNPRKTRINEIAVEICNIKIDIDKLRKKIKIKLQNKDRKAIELTNKLAKLEERKNKLESEFFEIL